jgi:cytidyltransferase-like protein
MKKYNIVVSGGTFDHFHKGHETFILAQVALSEKVLIGITGDAYVKEHKGVSLETYKTRAASVEQFLLDSGIKESVELAQIEDVFIPAVWKDYAIEAIVTTEDTKKGADYINEQRKKNGLSLLPVEVIDEVRAWDGGIVSSSRIRNGEIDREGNPFISPEWLSKTIYLPQQLRSTLQKPFGTLFSGTDDWLKTTLVDQNHVISVGDIVTKTLLEKNFYPKVVIVDLIVERKPFFDSIEQHNVAKYTIIKVSNPAGSLTSALFQAAKEITQDDKQYALYILGEEDLAVLPIILAAPLGFVILYGQPHSGIIAVEVTEEKKKYSKELAQKFIFQPQNNDL